MEYNSDLPKINLPKKSKVKNGKETPIECSIQFVLSKKNIYKLIKSFDLLPMNLIKFIKSQIT